MHLVEIGAMSMVVAVHADGISSVGRKTTCNQVAKYLNPCVPITIFGELRLYAGYRFSRDFDSRMITVSQRTVTKSMVAAVGVTQEPLR